MYFFLLPIILMIIITIIIIIMIIIVLIIVKMIVEWSPFFKSLSILLLIFAIYLSH